MLSGNVMEVKFSGTIDDKPKYLNPPEPDGINAEIGYLRNKMFVLPFKFVWNPRGLDLRFCWELYI